MSKTLVDDDGENKAVRAFLALYGGQHGITVSSMRLHMRMCGWEDHPQWVKDAPSGMHLTKGAAQAWIRHLFSLEETLKVSSDGSALINSAWAYTEISESNKPPQGVKMMLINKDLGSATLSTYDENSGFTHYAGLPKIKKH